MANDEPFTPQDLEQLQARGISPAEARRQLALLSSPPPDLRLDRPCTVGDGILRLSESDLTEAAVRGDELSREGRVGAFIPASGAATRMFRDLLAFAERPAGPTRAELEAERAAGSEAAAAVIQFLDGLERFPFFAALDAACGGKARTQARADAGPLLRSVLGSPGLGFAETPKGLIPFHAYRGETRTAFEEHLVESAHVARDSRGECRLHFTVSPEHLEEFLGALAHARSRLEGRLGVRFDVGFSTQKPSSDTIAARPDGSPFRDSEGRLVLRPAGHGALIQNLSDQGGDLVFLKNVDNVAVDRLKPHTYLWMRALLGILGREQEAARGALARLSKGDAAARADAQGFLARLAAGGPAPETPRDPERLAAALRRPLRVCGMVPNTGEPGGGPFWVRGQDSRLSSQIVESAQVEISEPEQATIFRAATHFNPVFMACALGDEAGRPHDLAAWVDPAAAIVTRKSAGGRDLVALERPGLLNGAMAGWNTILVEVPIEVFNPVKSVLDLLRPEHQA